MNSKSEDSNAPRSFDPDSKPRKKRPPKEITEDYLHNAGLFYLQRFAASRKRFHEVMMDKVYKSCAYHKHQKVRQCREIVDALTEKFTELDLLNDRRYAEALVRSQRQQGKSQRAIIHNLRSKGLSSSDIDEALCCFDQEDDLSPQDTELRAAAIFARKKKLGPFQNKQSRKHKNKGAQEIYQKNLAAMGRAGFEFSIAQKILEMNEEQARALINH